MERGERDVGRRSLRHRRSRRAPAAGAAPAAGVVAASLLWSAEARDLHGLGCTAMAIDGAATVDGSAFAGMNTDCSSCDPRVAWIPGAEHKEGAERPLYIFSGVAPRFVGYGRGAFYEPKDGQNESKSMGSIPQVRKTFGYWEGALPLMNEKGLALGESSCASRLLNYPLGQAPKSGDQRSGGPPVEALLDLANLMQIALERCETARCGVETMGALSEEHGFFPMVGEWSLGLEADGKVAFDDGGEAITLADRSGEAWVFHVVGGVPGVAKSAWAAMRLPKGHAAFIANNFILRKVPKEPSDDWLFSRNIRDVARAAGLWNGKEPLDFARVFAPDTVTFQSPAGEAPIPLYASLRQWRMATLVAPKALGKHRLPIDPLDLPSMVPVEQPLHVEDVFALLSDLYQGTEFDLTQGILSGPFGNPFRLEGGSATAVLGQVPRGIAIARTSYSVIGQSRPKSEPVMWFAPDTPATSVFLPFYLAAKGERAPSLATGTLTKFSRDSAFWAFDFVANWASLVNWRHASEHFLLPLRRRLQEELLEGMGRAEADSKREGPRALAQWQVRAQQQVVDRWWELADELIVMYNDGFLNNGSNLGVSLGYPEWWAREIGFNQDVHPIFVMRDQSAKDSFKEEPDLRPPGFQPPRSDLPGGYNFAAAQWLYPDADRDGDRRRGHGCRAGPAASTKLLSQNHAFVTAAGLMQLLAGASLFFLGIFIGRSSERRRRRRCGEGGPGGAGGGSCCGACRQATSSGAGAGLWERLL